MWPEPKNLPSEQLGSFQDLGSAGVFYPLEGSREKSTQPSLRAHCKSGEATAIGRESSRRLTGSQKARGRSSAPSPHALGAGCLSFVHSLIKQTSSSTCTIDQEHCSFSLRLWRTRKKGAAPLFAKFAGNLAADLNSCRAAPRVRSWHRTNSFWLGQTDLAAAKGGWQLL